MRPAERAHNYWAEDGYRYGVRFGDGSVRDVWNGKTQQANAEAEAFVLSLEYAPDVIEAVRRSRDGGDWETYQQEIYLK